ncbi:hypothetical protein [Xenorhabdus griffiniae]|uniref:Uncharacterized protein n=1 Tax=Xenorhabdus griffiniae TaxID=351672 RepID=A0ABY9XJR9_9GAMM|nr:hypothetical protein [Xenorhabdus griffiniae]MBD1227619.1 hypothetical protein [Xenorhabdus griffiniae]MBE8589229.1 hypothetical protein [Xenorhabdus griffiniae]WMV73184.1 hypothetical protein QL128_03845 [Xenorhabdus griffiniae]WNH02863.1 hypothetical protein QL112_003850 [Xenorhabdus griffiniae]
MNKMTQRFARSGLVFTLITEHLPEQALAVPAILLAAASEGSMFVALCRPMKGKEKQE